MSPYLLVHDLFVGAWCWERVAPLLRASGHAVEAIDLPGQGKDRTPPLKVSMQSYVDRICSALSANSVPVVLVSHCASGVWASQAAELLPDRVARLIFVASVIPRSGESLMDWAACAPDSLTVANMVTDETNGTVSLAPEISKEVLFEDCPSGDLNDAIRRMRPAPIGPLAEPVTLSEARFGRLPRSYILCERDRSIPRKTQELICKLSPCERVQAMDTGHAPYYAAPEMLVAHLVKLGR